MAKNDQIKSIETLIHKEASRKNIPTAEYQSVMRKDEKSSIQVAYERRNQDLDPQLVWRGKDVKEWSDLIVQAPPLYIQEKVHPKVLVDDLRRQTELEEQQETQQELNLFADFNGLPDEGAKTEFYQHDANWTNRMILGDSLQVMASLAEREGLRGKVQCIYLDPPYGIKFNSNFQWSTTSRDVKDGKTDHITREPEQVKAFRDTWRDGIHSYLTYLRDRLSVARDLLTESGSIFVQISDENVHHVREILDEIFGIDNFVSQLYYKKTTGAGSPGELVAPASVGDYIIWYSKNKSYFKYRKLYREKDFGGEGSSAYKKIELQDGTRMSISEWEKANDKVFEYYKLPIGCKVYGLDNLTSQSGGENARFPIIFEGNEYTISKGSWKTSQNGINNLIKHKRIDVSGKGGIGYIRYFEDFPVNPLTNLWTDTVGQNQYGGEKVYVVQTSITVAQRCLLMTTDPGDLVLDPTCGSGTTAYVAEQWGRRWITIDTSRVALALARARIMGARYPYYILADSREGQEKESSITQTAPSGKPVYHNIRQGFVYERVPHITLKSIANNTEIDVIWDKFQNMLEPLREELNKAVDRSWQEWEIPREPGYPWPEKATKSWEVIQGEGTVTRKQNALKQINSEMNTRYTMKSLPDKPYDMWTDKKAISTHGKWWDLRIARQKEIDASIAAKADFEYLYDKPYEDRKKVRVAGPFTVESLSPHRVMAVDENDELVDTAQKKKSDQGVNPHTGGEEDFVRMILENLKTSGVQQAHKEDKITFSSIKPWPGDMICAEGVYYVEGNKEESGKEKRAAIFIGPEFGTVSRVDLVAATREAGDADFDVLVACAFNYDAHSTEFDKLGRVPVLKARMNADLHMADDLKNTGKGNLFVIFGEPDIDILDGDNGMIKVKINGVDVFHPGTGEVRSDGAEGIACWFIDTDYNEESFFVRQAYFLGANDPYKSLKTTLKSEINKDAWDSLNSDVSRPFDKPASGRIAVKVINHLGDEVMKVFRVK
ncbi:MAG: site-specific DNA-methyltransferase [Desulfamplus sp.]|nr:site-specific DNA-methyltransferase [Desulfamplus sp.]